MGEDVLFGDIDKLDFLATQLSSYELGSLTALFPVMDRLAAYKGVPKAYGKQVERARKLVETAIVGDAPVDATIDKLRELVSKMCSALRDAAAKIAPPDTPPITDAAEDIFLHRDPELLRKFVSIQSGAMDDFEVYILELEKGNVSARNEIRRCMHTLKGEFGALGLDGHAHLLHELEDAFENGSLAAEHLLRFKDWLSRSLPLLLLDDKSQPSAEERSGMGLSNSLSDPASEQSGTDSPESVTLPVNQDPSFFADFVTESFEHVHVMETRLLDLETNSGNDDALNSVFRACHTIKGLAGFLELGDIQKIAHAMESLMDRARNNQLILTVAHTDLLLSSADCIKEQIRGVELMLKGEVSSLPATYAELMRKLRSPEMLEDIRKKDFSPGVKVGEILVDNGIVSADSVNKALQIQKDGDSRKLGEILIEEQRVPPRAVGQALEVQTQVKQQTQSHQGIEESVRVPVNRLDQLIDAIGEAVIAQSMIVADSVIADVNSSTSADARDLLRRKVARAELIMRQIQELSMSLRMVSIKGVFQKMMRLARDLSKKMDKKLDFILEGENTELDKTVVENIGDPLVHMVRNAIDHGLESTEERKASGKNPVARVVMRAFHKAGSVYIEIEDDGRGLNRERILTKAIEQKLISADANLPDSEIWGLIFRPGFSTAAKVTDVSGRGVGMDVVRRNIEALRGSIEIASNPGKGTLFTIRLPLTLAIIDGMVVRTRKERYIVPTLSIHATVKPAPEQLSTVTGKGEVLNLRGELIRLVRLADVFSCITEGGRAKESVRNVADGVVLVVEDLLGKKVGLLVDEILDQQQVVIKNLGAMGDVPGVTGGAIMNDGSVALILDVGGVIKNT